MDEIDDIFGSVDDTETAPSGAKGNNPTAEMRKHIKELETELKKVKPEYEELKTFKAQYDSEQRDVQLKTVFSEVGVPDKAVKFYKLEFPEGEVSKEAVAKWAVENGLAPEEGYSGTNTDQGFAPTVHGDSFVPGAKTYTRKEFEALLASNDTAAHLEANKAIEQGRVNLDVEP